MASTATATPQVASDIARRLGLRDPVKVTTGFDRPNLSFVVVPCRTTVDKHARIAAALADPAARPAIVYAGTRAGTQALAARLTETLGIDVPPYHAGLGREARAAAQRRFMAGEVEVVVATNAFGMGVDKADVRTVCHETVPGSLEAYYQEAGRAGRDGLPARALLFAEGRDKGLHVFFIERSRVDDALVLRVASRLAARAEEGRYDVSVDELVAQGCEEDAVRSIVGHLARAGVVHPAPASPDRLRGRVLQRFDGRAAATCRSSASEAERARWRQYRSIWGFVERADCRRAAILKHFGDRAAPAALEGVACCDVCAPEVVPEPPASAARAGPGPRRDYADLDEAILDVVETAKPVVGRTGATEILRGSRSKKIQRNSYDGLPAYGAYAHLRADDVMTRIDGLVSEGRLRLTGGAYPTLRLADPAAV